MAPFARKQTIESFWAWWADGGAGTVERLFGEGEMRALAAEIVPRLPSARPALAWEVGGGVGALELYVRADGVAKNRALAEAWRRAAPRTPRWSFRTARPAHDIDGATLSIRGLPDGLALADIEWAVTADASALLANVGAYHPAFESIAAGAAQEVAELALRAALGDDDVDRWVRRVLAMRSPGEHTVDTAGLRESIRHLGELRDLEPWFMFEDDEDGDPFRGRRSRQRPVDNPSLDMHLTVSARYAVSGFPSTERTTKLDRIERDWTDLPGRIELVAVGEGSGQRIWHFYSAGADREARDHFRAWVKAHAGLNVKTRRDPAWTDLG